MNKKIKYWISCFVIVCILIASSNIYAASISGNSNAYVGDTVTYTFNFGTSVGAYDNLAVSYDSNMLEYISGDSLREDVWWDSSVESRGITTKTYTFRAKNAGTARVTVVVNGATGADENMTGLGTITAEKMVTVANRKTEEAPKVETTPQQQGNVTPSAPSASGNNYLKYLQISEEGLSPVFTRNITDYAISVGEGVNSIEVLARAEDSNARVEVSGNENLVDGDNEINIKVTAQNGYYRIYTITVTKVADVSKSNAFLNSLIIEGYELNREFQSEALEYNIGEILSTVKKLNISATTQDNASIVEVIGADKLVQNGNGEVIVKVTAPDRKTVKEYKIKYTVKAATIEEEQKQEMKDYLKEIQDGKSKKEIVLSYAKYIWTAIKKNYVLVIMYVLVVFEFIHILILKSKLKKVRNDNDDNPDDDNKTILKVDKEQEENKVEFNNVEQPQKMKIEPPKVDLLDTPVLDEVPRMGRSGSRADSIEGEETEGKIQLVDLDKNEGPKDELTFNIFENLNDEDIKKMLEEQMDEDE